MRSTNLAVALFRPYSCLTLRILLFESVVVVKTLGYSGMFTGARACLLRDIPFGALYFPTYTLIKENLPTWDGDYSTVSAANLLLAGTLAGIPASLLTT